MLSWDDKADSERVNKKVINKKVTAYWLRLIRRNIHTKPKLMNSNYESEPHRLCFQPLHATASHPGKNNMSKKKPEFKV